MLVLEASEHSDVPHSNLAGYLYKKATNGEWQKRYFEINGSYLTYYKSQKMTKLLAALSIPQVGAIKFLGPTEDGVEFRIDIKDRQYILRAATQHEADLWISTLTRVRDAAGTPNPISTNSRDRTSSQSSYNSHATTSTTVSATMQKAKRNSCWSCITRCFGM
jgi:hypothetical protein